MGGPVMKMYFFEDLPFYLLFKSWTPSNRGQLAGAWFAVFAMGLLYELLQMLYGRYEADFWAKQQARAAAAVGRRCGVASRSFIDVEAASPVAEGAEDGLGTPLNIDGSSDGSRDANGEPPNCCSGRAAAGAAGAEPRSSSSSHYIFEAVQQQQQQQQKSGLPMLQHHSLSANSALGPAGAAAGTCCKSAAADGICTSNSCAKGRCRTQPTFFGPELLMMDVIRGVSRFVLAGLAYLLMLAAMSYHVAIFFAVISGVGVGSMLFGRWRFKADPTEGFNHCG
jgi:hypothetical protein